jgi:hypothetical protein
MFKFATIVLVILAAAFVMFSIAHGRSLRHASLINGVNQLRVAQRDYAERGYITNSPTSGFRVSVSTNVITVGSTQYHCFFAVTGGWGWEGGTLTMTTNQTLIWIDTRMPAKIITLGYRPPFFGGPY